MSDFVTMSPLVSGGLYSTEIVSSIETGCTLCELDDNTQQTKKRGPRSPQDFSLKQGPVQSLEATKADSQLQCQEIGGKMGRLASVPSSAFHQHKASPIPSLYDTSVSSTNEDSTMDAAPPSPQRLLAVLGRTRDPEFTQSEPGVKSPEHDRFSAYVNRFAEFDPRMDYRGAHFSQGNDAKEERRDSRGADLRPSSSTNTITSSAMRAAMRAHKGRTQHTESRLSKILSKHAGVAAAQRHARAVGTARGMETSSDIVQGRSNTSNRIREGLERYTDRNNHESYQTPVRLRQKPAISSPRNSLLRAVTDLRAGKHIKPEQYRGALQPRASSAQRSARPHHFISPPTSPETTTRQSVSSRSRSAPRRLASPPPLLDAMIHQVDARSAIEIPSPSKVRDIRERLWTANERLRVPSKQQQFKNRFYQAAERAQDNEEVQPVKLTANAIDAQERRQNMIRLSNEVPGQRSSITGLIERLEKVNRDNPKVALEEIDEILRSQSSVQEDSAVENLEEVMKADEKKEQDASSSEGDSTVSSITNPTYQEVSKKKKRAHLKKRASRNRKLQSETIPEATPPTTLGTLGQASNAPTGRTFAEMRRDLKRNDSDSGIIITEEATVDPEKCDSGVVTPDTSVVMSTPMAKRHDDDISNGVIPTSVNERDASPASRQPHPWETAVPFEKIKCADTTMSNADGIETNIATPDRSKSSRRLGTKKDRIQRDWNAEPIVEEAKKPYEPFTSDDTGDAADVEFGGFAPPHVERSPSVHLDQPTADALASDFDSAWVSLPASKYFGLSERYKKRVSKSSPRSRRSSRRSGGFDVDSHDGDEAPIAYLPVDLEKDDVRFSPGRRQAGSGSSSSFKPYSDLNTYIDRTTQNKAISSDQKTYTSTGSKRFKDLRSKIEHNSQPGQLLPTRGVATNQETDRNRSRSVETKRIRNPKIAKKYSRVLRVYEDDMQGRR